MKHVQAQEPQGTQGNKDSNGNPCYCNPPEKNSNKQCLAGYTCESHKCVGPGPAGVCQESADVDDVPEGGTCDVIAGKVCVEGLNCVDGICRQMGQKKAQLVPAGGACGAPDAVCAAGTECLDGVCRACEVLLLVVGCLAGCLP